MAASINGIGTRFYGAGSPRRDGSTVTTKWFAVIFIPLIPLSSYRVIRNTKSDKLTFFGHSASYVVLEKLPINWAQVLRTYAFAFFYTIWIGFVCVGAGWAADNWLPPLWANILAPFVLAIVPFILLDVVRAMAMKRVKNQQSG